MHPCRVWPALAILGFTVLGACDGCKGLGTPAPAEIRDAAEHKHEVESRPREELGESPVLVIEASRLLLAGKLDKENRYSSTVVVYARVNGQEKRCSGVLIARRTVLTAGHCVCAQRMASLIDTSICAQTASIKTISYTPAEGLVEDLEEAASSNSDLYFGAVKPHPGLKVLLDEQGGVVSSTADFAVIHLTAPIKLPIFPVLLSGKEVQLSDQLIIVGQGYDEITNSYDENRRFSKNTVTRIPLTEDERILVRQPEDHIYKGDSGGPCLRESSGRALLIGISSRHLGKGAACTSTYTYRGWLQSEIRPKAKNKTR